MNTFGSITEITWHYGLQIGLSPCLREVHQFVEGEKNAADDDHNYDVGNHCTKQVVEVLWVDEDPLSLTAARCGVNDSLVLRIVFFMYCLGVESGP